MRRDWLAAVALLAAALPAAPAQADAGISVSPSPGYAGSSEQFSACGFQSGETADLSMDGSVLAQATADGGGCIQVSQDMPRDIAQTSHLLAAKGEASGAEQDGVYVVMPPTIVGGPAPVLPGGVAIASGQFFAPLRSLTLIPQGGIPPVPAVTDPSGSLTVQIPVLPNTPPGAYPVLIQDGDDPAWLSSPPTLIVTVLPMPTDTSASPQPGGWTLKATSTLKGAGPLSASGSGSDVAQFTVSGGQVKGHGQLSISIEMSAADASCHGASAPAPFDVGGTQDGSGLLHLTFTGVGAAIPITVTCSNGLTLPFTLPGGGGSETFDIAGQDGASADFDGSNPFLMVPANFTGQTHVVLTAG